MKIIEALKEIPLIEKKIKSNNKDLLKYASYCNKIGPSFKDKNEQEKQVISLIQSNIDLAERRLVLKRILTKTNCTTLLGINDKMMTIVEWIEYKNKIGELLKETYNSLKIENATKQITQTGGITEKDAETVLIEKCFDEKYKNSGLEKVQGYLDKITGALEVFNAMTDLVESVQ